MNVYVLDDDGNKVFEFAFTADKPPTKTEIKRLIAETDDETEALRLWRMLRNATDTENSDDDGKAALEAVKEFFRVQGFIRTRKPSNIAGIIIRDEEDTVVDRFNTTTAVASFLGISSMLSWERAAALLRKRFPEGRVALVEKERKV